MMLELVERDKCLCMGEFRRGINLAKYVVCGDEKNCKMYGECQQGKVKRMCPKKYNKEEKKTNLFWLGCLPTSAWFIIFSLDFVLHSSKVV